MTQTLKPLECESCVKTDTKLARELCVLSQATFDAEQLYKRVQLLCVNTQTVKEVETVLKTKNTNSATFSPVCWGGGLKVKFW